MAFALRIEPASPPSRSPPHRIVELLQSLQRLGPTAPPAPDASAVPPQGIHTGDRRVAVLVGRWAMSGPLCSASKRISLTSPPPPPPPPTPPPASSCTCSTASSGGAQRLPQRGPSQEGERYSDCASSSRRASISTTCTTSATGRTLGPLNTNCSSHAGRPCADLVPYLPSYAAAQPTAAPRSGQDRTSPSAAPAPDGPHPPLLILPSSARRLLGRPVDPPPRQRLAPRSTSRARDPPPQPHQPQHEDIALTASARCSGAGYQTPNTRPRAPRAIASEHNR